ncbi:MAG: hypothetical protein HZA52_16730 [Planctomycetes bacterium]|nr:hypothetical protein [Planctomycetota bacterium]
MNVIKLKDAVSAARAFFQAVYAEEKLLNVLLEEVKVSDDERFWLVTFGFSLANELPPLGASMGRMPPRHYKVVRVDGVTGEVKAMVLRESE